MKRDLRKTLYCVLDTETCPIVPSEKVDAHNMLVYDVGYRIIDKKNNCYLERSFVVDEIFFGESERMRTSYYKDKIPQYFTDLGNGTRVLAKMNDIMKIFRKDLKEYNVKIVSAHNAYFDYTALKTTLEWLKFEKPYFFPYGITIWDTMKMARDTICKNKTYPFYTPKGRKSAKAEDLYRYITMNYDFEESHTGLEDTKIESVILCKCLSTHKKMRKNLWKDKKED